VTAALEKRPRVRGWRWAALAAAYGVLCVVEWVSGELRRRIADRLFPREDQPPHQGAT